MKLIQLLWQGFGHCYMTNHFYITNNKSRSSVSSDWMFYWTPPGHLWCLPATVFPTTLLIEGAPGTEDSYFSSRAKLPWEIIFSEMGPLFLLSWLIRSLFTICIGAVGQSPVSWSNRVKYTSSLSSLRHYWIITNITR